jgi:uncharacterized protein (TIGR03086 family)
MTKGYPPRTCGSTILAITSQLAEAWPTTQTHTGGAKPVGDLIAEVRPEQWKAPTPCPDWNVRDVVSHLAGLDLVFTALIEGGPMPERGADRLGDDPVRAYRASNASLQAAFARPGVPERSYLGPLGVPRAPSACRSACTICSLMDGTSAGPTTAVRPIAGN